MNHRLCRTVCAAVTVLLGVGVMGVDVARAGGPVPGHVHEEGCSCFVGQDQGAGAADVTTEAKRMGVWGFDLAGMDRSVRPGDDFFAYVGGTWAKTATIPADRSRYGAFDALRVLSEVRVRAMLEELGRKTGPADTVSVDASKIATLYQSYLNEAEVERRDAGPIKPFLEQIRSAADRKALAVVMAKLAGGGFGGSLFSARVSEDAKNPEYYTLYIGQSGLGLPDREYYLRPTYAEQKARYAEYVAAMLKMAGWEGERGGAEVASADDLAPRIVALETSIAEASWTRAQSRDRDKTYNPTSVSALENSAPGFAWKEYLEASGLGKAETAVLTQHTAVPRLAEIYGSADEGTLRAWLAFKVIDEAAPLLSRRFADAQFEFRSKYLNGVPQQRDRAKRAASFTESAMGEAVGREYVARYFPASSKAKMEALVADLKAAMRGRIETLDWMSAETKAQAIEKLSKFGVKIAYPEQWRDYAGLEVKADDLFGNALRATRFNYAYRVSKLGQKVDPKEWAMTPQTVNAYYSSTRNEIVFPAAILQPPFFDPEADAAINYGAIGGVIGHEITHGFDDQGRKSDGDGVLRDWWTKADAEQFEAQAAKLGRQYEAFEFPTLPGSRIDPRSTMGENIADLGGVLLALDAYKLHLARSGKEAPVLDRFTGEQRVFLGWAQVWRTIQRDAALKQQLATDSHSPGFIRAFAPLRNVDAWYRAFDVKEGDRQYVKPEERVRIW